MTILTIKTDQPEAEIGLFDDKTQLSKFSWHAHTGLAETIHAKIKAVLESKKLSWNDIDGIVVYKGPGSFTGLRIGISIANSLAYGLDAPIAASSGEKWESSGISNLLNNKSKELILPNYGSPPHITPPKR
ncbi:MAG TPA: tRNA (adenosine(37)-N6)-threonylcarbamoyltransferase complex dimerization subunit type 1 TsaB [Candidatus Saccharimonadales bacterium]|nr:tRNA (adenosine(37)-N6)-threonylcarbamoyltransferase complex dimerization subunit type 1 TsaB [Candidatus Saccharimonadales bacterium]